MKRSELEKWKRLLGSIYPRLRNITEDDLLGWYLVLKPWEYEQCREAVVEFARVSRYIPDPSEIAVYLKRKYPAAEEPAENSFFDPVWVAYVKAKTDYYHRHGAHTFGEFCREHTGTCDELYDLWQDELIKAGATDPPRLRRNA